MTIYKTRRAILAFVLLGGALTSNAALANEAVNAYQMAVLSDTRDGRAILKGRYDVVIAKLRGKSKNRVETMTNLCVAYTLNQQYTDAAPYCEQAVEISSSSDSTKLAMALTNRGVLSAITGNLTNAVKDFERASSLDAGIDVPAENLSRLSNEL